MRCFAECIEHLGGIKRVPGPSEDEKINMPSYYLRLGIFLAARGLALVSIDRSCLRPGSSFRAWISGRVEVIAGGPCPALRTDHAVVAFLNPIDGTLKITFDPHPENPGISTWEEVWLLVKGPLIEDDDPKDTEDEDDWYDERNDLPEPKFCDCTCGCGAKLFGPAYELGKCRPCAEACPP